MANIRIGRYMVALFVWALAVALAGDLFRWAWGVPADSVWSYVFGPGFCGVGVVSGIAILNSLLRRGHASWLEGKRP